MLRADPSTGSSFMEYKSQHQHGSGIEKAPGRERERSHQLACDRCKGQKLRCIRSPNLRAPCERCQKAGATCTNDLSVRMGRPRRTEKGPRGSTATTTASASVLPNRSHSRTTSGAFTPNNDSWSGHNLNLDDTPDPTLQGMQYLEFVDIDIALQETMTGDKSLNMPPEHYLDPSLGLSIVQPVPSLATLTTRAEEDTVVDLTTENVRNPTPPIRQESTQELSNLNLELYQQLRILGSAVCKDSSIHPCFATNTPLGATYTSLSDAVVFMMHGLQTYHRLLIEILGFTGPNHDVMSSYCSHDQSRPSTTSDGMDMDSEDSRGPVSGRDVANQKPRLASQSDSSLELTASHSALLDLSTSLLLLSCHANLIYFCRDAFAAIRTALLNTHRPLAFFAVSLLHTTEISLLQDPDLQIIILAQAVMRLVESIGRLLGYSNNCEDGSGCERCEPSLRFHHNAIPPELLDLVLRQAASGESPLDRVGTEELREEIRGLYELVYRPV